MGMVYVNMVVILPVLQYDKAMLQCYDDSFNDMILFVLVTNAVIVSCRLEFFTDTFDIDYSCAL